MSTERGIVFNGEMVRAILDGRKTQTRRPVARVRGFGPVTEFDVSDTPGYAWHFRDKQMRWHDLTDERLCGCCPLGVPGDLLYVRETLAWHDGALFYDADSAVVEYVPDDAQPITRPRLPSIFMPKWAARIWLEVVRVRVERVQDIDHAGALAEGAFKCDLPPNPDAEWPPGSYGYVFHDNGRNPIHPTAVDAFQNVWDRLGYASWESNPWVWVCEFKRIER